MHNQIQQSSTATFLIPPAAGLRKSTLRKVPLLIVSALFSMVALFILASALLDNNQLTSSTLFATFIVFAGMYLAFTIAAILGTFELRKFENYPILAIIWEFIMFLLSGAVVQMLGDAKPTLLFNTIGFYVTAILSLSILFLGQVVQWPVTGVLDSLRGLNVAISLSLFKDRPVYTYVGMSYCFIMILVIRMSQVWQRQGQAVQESTSTPSGNETTQLADSLPEFSVTVDQQQILLEMAADAVAGQIF